jgi:PAS domain S-box-containing protein
MSTLQSDDLTYSKRRLRLALDAGRMGAWIWESSTNRVEWDESLELIYGLQPGTFGGTYEAFLSLVHPDDRRHVIDTVMAAGTHSADYEIEFRTIRPDGAVRWIADRGQVLFNDRGQKTGITGVCWDATERKRAEEELGPRAPGLRQSWRVSQTVLQPTTRNGDTHM